MTERRGIPHKNLVHKAIGIWFLTVSAIGLGHLAWHVPVAYGDQAPGRKAAIIDHLSMSWPNPSFVMACTALLEQTGYGVEYYEGKQVTVELFRKLPTHQYTLIVLRVHSAYIDKYLSLAMFTSEPYSKGRYVYEQLRNRVASGYIQPHVQGDPRYLVITDKFIRYSMEGTLNGAVVIMMGCTGIKRCAATAFLAKGARAYIGWNGPVSVAHTDRATLHLLEHLLLAKERIGVSVSQTMKEVGREPQYGSTLLFWPIESEKYTVPTVENTFRKTAHEWREEIAQGR